LEILEFSVLEKCSYGFGALLALVEPNT